MGGIVKGGKKGREWRGGRLPPYWGRSPRIGAGRPERRWRRCHASNSNGMWKEKQPGGDPFRGGKERSDALPGEGERGRGAVIRHPPPAKASRSRPLFRAAEAEPERRGARRSGGREPAEGLWEGGAGGYFPPH